jgi:magnesium-transporting ATPase (P-type)
MPRDTALPVATPIAGTRTNLADAQLDLTDPWPGLSSDEVAMARTEFVGIVLCQVGTAFAARTERASLRDIGVFTNRPLLWGIGFELVVAAAVIYAPPLQGPFGTSALSLQDVAPLLTFPFIVWGVDELLRSRRRRLDMGVAPVDTDNATPNEGVS